jgi:hypothetical protein
MIYGLLQSSVGISDILSIASNIVAPLVGALAAVIVWLHRRVRELEREQHTQGSSLYGTDSDSLNDGVIAEVQLMREELSEMQERLEELYDSDD